MIFAVLTLSSQATTQTPNGRRSGRARSNTAHSYYERYEPLHEEPQTETEPRPIIRSSQPVETGFPRPVFNRTPTFEGPSQLRQEQPSYQLPSRTNSENYMPRRDSSQVLPISTRVPSTDYYVNSPDDISPRSGNSPDNSYRGRSVSPAPSNGSVMSRRTSSTHLNGVGGFKKGPPPPPPSRAKKPPPPPPMKRTLLTVGDS